jgi:CubicO group peptidase (beta-lactamase class C family)
MPQALRQQAFGNVQTLSETRTVAASDNPHRLVSKPQDWSDLEYEVDGETFSLDDYFQRLASRGLIVLQGDEVLLERYGSGNTPETRWITFSVTKSVTSLLIGAAIHDGYIGSVDEHVTDYIPRLKGSAYEGVKIRDILHMASGVAWNEDYADPESDVAQAGAANGVELTEYLATLPREAQPGSRFNYNTGETNLVGELLRAAIGNNASRYLENKIWRPFGMEHDAYWLLSSAGGVETGGCCINATLRDYARIGRFVLADGVLPSGERVVPENWIRDSVTPSQGSENYGYLWWLYDEGAFSARGIFQQRIFIDPARDAVIATHGNALNATGDEDQDHTNAVIEALRRTLEPQG